MTSARVFVQADVTLPFYNVHVRDGTRIPAPTKRPVPRPDDDGGAPLCAVTRGLGRVWLAAPSLERFDFAVAEVRRLCEVRWYGGYEERAFAAIIP